jgi:hypothetical protein
VVVLVIARVFSPNAETLSSPGIAPIATWNLTRAQIERQLDATGEKHLVLVRYALNHDVTYEWVHNRADIDGSKVVWARDVRGQNLEPLLNYYRNRKIWALDADAAHPQLEPFRAAAAAESLH